MKHLKRKLDDYLLAWKKNKKHLPLIIKGARQIGKTFSIREFAKTYDHFLEINFVTEKKYKAIFVDGYAVADVVKNISLINPDFKFEKGKTLIFFDELQEHPDCATCLKFFAEDGKFDVICSGSMMGLNYSEIESNSVGYKEDYELKSMDFEEFLWARGYDEKFTDEIFSHMMSIKPFSQLQLDVLYSLFLEYAVLGGMPAVVSSFVENKNFAGTLSMQRQLLLDYEEDISKYATGLDAAKVKNVYHHISVMLAKENKKFQVTKIAKNARNRDYVGCVEWLNDSGIINVCYCLHFPELPLKANYDSAKYKIYFADTGLMVASLDDESSDDLRANKNLGVYKGALYENIVGDMLVKSGSTLYYYADEKSHLEMDFFSRTKKSLVPIEVKAKDGATISLKKLIESKNFPDIKRGIKFCHKNVGYNENFYTFPYFTAFLLKRFLAEQSW